jgi:two-component system, NtrC family, nitrogen regulation sensor histidine kinase NtrY
VVTLHASSPDGDEPAKGPRVELDAEPIPMVSADKDQIIQILTNLIQNGLDAASAVRSDPRVVVTIGPVPDAPKDRGYGGSGRGRPLSMDRVRIVVRDNGPGVPDEMRSRLFEPYATTKEKGTGLGLAIVQRIVVEHGGEITYREATKGGAVFEITLPVSGPSLLERPPAPEITARPSLTADRGAPRRAAPPEPGQEGS